MAQHWGSSVAQEFLGEDYQGTVVSDFFGACGIGILPYVVAEMEKGDRLLLPIAVEVAKEKAAIPGEGIIEVRADAFMAW